MRREMGGALIGRLMLIAHLHTEPHHAHMFKFVLRLRTCWNKLHDDFQESHHISAASPKLQGVYNGVHGSFDEDTNLTEKLPGL